MRHADHSRLKDNAFRYLARTVFYTALVLSSCQGVLRVYHMQGGLLDPEGSIEPAAADASRQPCCIVKHSQADTDPLLQISVQTRVYTPSTLARSLLDHASSLDGVPDRAQHANAALQTWRIAHILDCVDTTWLHDRDLLLNHRLQDVFQATS